MFAKFSATETNDLDEPWTSKATATNALGAVGAGRYILGCPAYSTFLTLETIINSQSIDCVNQYNQVSIFWINCNLSVADKAGLQNAVGYTEGTNEDGKRLPFEGRKLANAVVTSDRVHWYVIFCLVQQFTIGSMTNF